MDKAIKIHCMHCAVWQVLPITKKPQTVVKLFQALTTKAETKTDRQHLFNWLAELTEAPFPAFRWNFEGGGYYINGVPQSREIFTCPNTGKRYDIIGNFSENFVNGRT